MSTEAVYAAQLRAITLLEDRLESGAPAIEELFSKLSTCEIVDIAVFAAHMGMVNTRDRDSEICQIYFFMAVQVLEHPETMEDIDSLDKKLFPLWCLSSTICEMLASATEGERIIYFGRFFGFSDDELVRAIPNGYDHPAVDKTWLDFDMAG